MRGLLIGVLFAASCAARHPVAPDGHPDWLTTLIGQLESKPVANPPTVIAQYVYRGETGYLLPASGCDVWSACYASDGRVLCHPDGGLTGNGDGRCPAFFDERRSEQIVWRDPRVASSRRTTP